MTATEDIRDIFSILHDGTITAWTGTKQLLTLTVDCQYLAELIDKSFFNFYVDLIEVDTLFLDTWPNPFDLPVLTLTNLDEVFKAELEILSAEIKGDRVVITCKQDDIKFDYCGGNLTISCREIRIFDQLRREISIEKLDEICNSYWNKWKKS